MELLNSITGIIFTPWSLIACLVITVILYWKNSKLCDTWKNQGIPGPRPIPFFGVNPLRVIKIGMPAFVEDCLDKYGKNCGLIIGRKAVLVTKDPETIKQVTIKEFSNFTNKPTMDLQISTAFKSVATLLDDDWKRVRSTITPIFSTSKMKQMVPLIQESLQTLVMKLNRSAEEEKSVDIGELYGKFTMETIFKSVFGIEAKNQTDPEDKHTVAAAETIKLNYFTTVLSMFLPLCRHLNLLQPVKIQSISFLLSTAKRVMEHRRQHGHPQRTDLLKLMMEAELKTDDGSIINKLSNKEVEAQCLTFLIAGYETTATTLMFTSFALATHPEIQEQLIAEIDGFFPENSLPDYDTVWKLEYLDKVLNESLRMYSPAQVIRRLCKEDCMVNGIKIPKDAAVVMHVTALQHDPEIWENPEKFDPERFSAESKATRHQCSYIPFSLGPRNCVGMRFAILEAKMALIQVLRNFRIEATPETKCKLNSKDKLVLSADGGIFVRLVKRKM